MQGQLEENTIIRTSEATEHCFFRLKYNCIKNHSLRNAASLSRWSLIYVIMGYAQCFCGWGFGSCHSFGVAVGLRGYGMCQMRWAIRRRIFLKMRRVGCIFCPMLFFQSPSCREAVHLSPGKFLLENCQPFFETEFLSGHIATNVCVSAVAGIGGLSNGAKRNAKADQLRLVPLDKCN